jgi:hypothetical protein
MVHDPAVPYRVTFCLRRSAHAAPTSVISTGVPS